LNYISEAAIVLCSLSSWLTKCNSDLISMAFTEPKQTAARTIPAPKHLQQMGLTVREGEVLHWVIQGKRDKEVADILSASPRTIHNHLRSILRKLNTETRTGAAIEAFERLNGSSASRGL